MILSNLYFHLAGGVGHIEPPARAFRLLNCGVSYIDYPGGFQLVGVGLGTSFVGLDFIISKLLLYVYSASGHI